MSFLLDTSIILELRKGGDCDPSVAAWWAGVSEHELWLSALVLGEIRKCMEIAQNGGPPQGDAFETWLEDVIFGFGERVLSVDSSVTDEWGRMNATRSLPVTDALLAATAKIHGLTLVTRNEANVAGLGVDVLNPFSRE